MSEKEKSCGCSCSGSNDLKDPKLVKNILPGLDCKKCGYGSCYDFAVSLNEGKSNAEDCSPLMNPLFTNNLFTLKKMFEEEV